MRFFFQMILALTSLFAVACTPEIKVPKPEITLPPELVAAVGIAIAGNGGNDQACPPEQHDEPADGGLDADNDGVTETEVDWFDPFTVHGNITVVCPESCTIRMTLPNGFKWNWLVPGTTERVTEFTFAGELLVPAADQADFHISPGGPIDGEKESSYVEVGEENILLLTTILPNGGEGVFTTHKYSMSGGHQVGHWTPMKILHLKKIANE